MSTDEMPECIAKDPKTRQIWQSINDMTKYIKEDLHPELAMLRRFKGYVILKYPKVWTAFEKYNKKYPQGGVQS